MRPMLQRQTGIRVSDDLRSAIDNHRDCMRRDHPGMCVSTADAMRDLMERGLRTLRKQTKKAG